MDQPLLIGPLKSWLGQLTHMAVSFKGRSLFHADYDIAEPIVVIDGVAYQSAIAILDTVQALYPEPDLFPNGNRGMPLALIPWSKMAGMGSDKDKERAAELIQRQLADGRAFLQGPAMGLADILARAALMDDVSKTLEGWQNRIINTLQPILESDKDHLKTVSSKIGKASKHTSVRNIRIYGKNIPIIAEP